MSINCHSVNKVGGLRSTLLFTFLFSLLFLSPYAVSADATFNEVTLVEDELLLLDAKLNGDYIANAIDAFPHQGRTLIAIEPLFEALNIKYQLHTDQLIIWKGVEKFILPLSKTVSGNFFSQIDEGITDAFWANDGFYLFIDDKTLASFFGVNIEVNTFQLRMKIATQSYLFPIQRMKIQEQQRMLEAAISKNHSENNAQVTPEITIADQYSLFTVPHGRVSTSLDLNNANRKNAVSVQLTSDLLYHSAQMTLGKVNGGDLSTNLTLSRYKTKPNDYILGLFDQYSFGDISGYSNNLTTRASAGLGVQFNRAPKNFRRRNLAITIEETAPPGWEAELFHNGRFISVATVPDDGLLVLEDVLTEYGNNYYQIKLYGPYGEKEIIEKYVNLTQNALSENAMAYNVYGLDRSHSLIADDNNADRKLTDFGGTFDYGITDNWQLGFGFANVNGLSGEASQQYFSMKNAFSFPGFLVENDLSFDQGFGYAQLTSITGNIFDKERFYFSYESADNYTSARVNARNSHVDIVNGGISGSLGFWGYGFSALYQKQENSNSWEVRNRLSRSFHDIHFTHTLSYSNFENEFITGTALDQVNKRIITDEALRGSINVSGRVFDNVRLSSTVAYNPSDDDIILDTSAATIEWSPKFYGINNYITARYLPLKKGNKNWQLSYRTAWNNDDFELNLGANYNADDTWNFNLGVRFFFGYDYHNNRVLFRNKISNNSATINTYSYLDRQANGIPDPLDYNLPGIEFFGNPEWQGIQSGENGRAILPGVSVGGAFRFDAKWKEGSKAVNKNYVVYTHPGAYINVNMPFNLTTEISGFVQRSGNAIPLNRVKMELHSQDGTVITTKTDIDGYYEFLNLSPAQYKVFVSSDYLRDKGLTADIIGYQFASPKAGGFIELTTLELNRSGDANDIAAEAIAPFQLTEDNSEAIVWDDDENKRREYFNLPPKGKIATKHSLNDKPQLASSNKTTDPVESLAKETSDELSKVSVLTQSPDKAEPKHKALNTASNESKIIEAIESNQGLLPTITFAKQALIKPVLSVNRSKPVQEQIIATGAAEVNDVEDKVIKNNLVTNNTITQALNKPKVIASSNVYTIQLGAFSLKTVADAAALKYQHLSQVTYVEQMIVQGAPAYKVLLGRFNNKSAADDFAKKNLLKNQSYYLKKITSKANNENQKANVNKQALLNVEQVKSGWVIQYYAGSSIDFQSKAAKKLNIATLFKANKTSAAQGILYCLISEVFATKEAAILAKEQQGIDGWITTSALFSNIESVM